MERNEEEKQDQGTDKSPAKKGKKKRSRFVAFITKPLNLLQPCSRNQRRHNWYQICMVYDDCIRLAPPETAQCHVKFAKFSVWAVRSSHMEPRFGVIG